MKNALLIAVGIGLFSLGTVIHELSVFFNTFIGFTALMYKWPLEAFECFSLIMILALGVASSTKARTYEDEKDDDPG
ncbi:MAG: hypothetical protein WC702_04685 [Patescibacteria group bacterium]